jgi:dTDP-4-dehydrorhamnose reductase
MGDKGILILGASGFIGRYLFDYLKNENHRVIGTYTKNKKPDLFFFDAISSSLEELPLDKMGYCIICSAISKIDECKTNSHSASLNVIGLKKVIKTLKEKSIIPVFISSAAVFDGFRGNYKEDDIKNPQNVYGIQKKEVEDFIISDFKDYLIIRLNKIFGIARGDDGIFRNWLDKYKNNCEICCAYDEELSLTYICDVVRGIEKLIEKGKTGTFHIDSGIHKSRLEFAKDFFEYLRIDDAKIKTCSLDAFNFAEKRAKKSYLDSSKFINQTGFEFTSMEECYKIIKKEM